MDFWYLGAVVCLTGIIIYCGRALVRRHRTRQIREADERYDREKSARRNCYGGDCPRN